MEQQYNIGILHSLSGSMSNSERPLVDAVILAIEEINQAGGVLGHQLSYKIADGESKLEAFSLKADELIASGCEHIFGCWTSYARKAVKPLVEAGNSLLWYPVQYEGFEASDNIFYTGLTLNQQILPALGWCNSKSFQRYYLIGSDYVFPQTAHKLIKFQIKKDQNQLVGEEFSPMDEQDFTQTIANIKQANPDVILNCLNGSSNQAFYQQLYDAGFKATQYPVMAFSIGEVEIQSFKEAAKGHFACWSFFDSTDHQEAKKFIARFKQKFGAERAISDPMATAYSQLYLWKQAVEKAGTFSPDQVREAAIGITYNSPAGRVEIHPNQHLSKPVHIGQAQATGHFNIVWSSDEAILPKPWLGLASSSPDHADLITELLAGVTTESQQTWALKEEIQKRKKVEEDLEQKNKCLNDLIALIDKEKRKFHQTFDNAALGIAHATPDGTFIEANNRWCQFLGYDAEELMTMNFQQITHPDDLEKYLNFITDLKAGTINSFSMEKRYLKKTGEIIWVSLTVSLQRKPNDEADFFIATIEDITEKKQETLKRVQAEKALEEKNEDLKQLIKTIEVEKEIAQGYLDVAQVMIVVLDNNGTVQLINQIGCKILGYSSEEIIGSNWFDCYLPERVKADIVAYTKKILAGEVEPLSEFENPIITKTGKERLITWKNAVLHNEQGKTIGHLSSGRDITGQKEIQEQLQQKSSELESLFSNMINGFALHKIITDPEGKPIDYTFVKINKAFTRLTGLSAEMCIGKRVTELTPDIQKDPADWIGKYGAVALQGKELSFENYAEGLNKWFRINAFSPLKGEFATVIEEITSAKEAHEILSKRTLELEESDAFWHSLAEDSPDLIMVVSKNLTIDYINHPAPGLVKEDVLGQPVLLFIENPVDKARAEKILKLVLSTGEPSSYSIVYPSKDGQKVYYSSRVIPQFIDGKVVSLTVTSTDTTEQQNFLQTLQEAKSQAEQANRAKSKFLSLMSHELRTPMNGVLGMAQMLKMSELSNDQQVHCDIILNSGNALINILTDILDLSKIEAGQQQVHVSQFSIGRVVEDVAKLFLGSAKTKLLNLTYQIEAPLNGMLTGDPELLRRILSNLIGNAVKFTHKGSISISATTISSVDQQTLVAFKIIDSGIGMASDMLQKIFEPFAQIDDTDNRKYEGTGLGLSIVKELVDILNGTIEVQSTPGKGSCFVIQLPFQSSNSTQPQTEYIQNVVLEPEELEEVSVLLVEDDKTNQTVINLMLKKLNMKVRIVNNGEEGVKLASETKFDLIFMDLLMPIMSGYDATTAIRQSTENLNCETPIIALTAMASKGDQDKCLKIGMNHYLTKPIDFFLLKNITTQYRIGGE